MLVYITVKYLVCHWIDFLSWRVPRFKLRISYFVFSQSKIFIIGTQFWRSLNPCFTSLYIFFIYYVFVETVYIKIIFAIWFCVLIAALSPSHFYYVVSILPNSNNLHTFIFPVFVFRLVRKQLLLKLEHVRYSNDILIIYIYISQYFHISFYKK